MSLAVISPTKLAELAKAGNKIDLIDVRAPSEFREIHVEYAQHSVDRTRSRGCDAGRGSSTEDPLYIVCRTGSRGEQACQQFLKAGFTNVLNVEGGTLACVDAGLPVVRGKKAISLERQVRIVAGSLVLLGILLGWLIHPAFLGLSAFVGAGLVFAGITDTCGMGLLLLRMPWNR